MKKLTFFIKALLTIVLLTNALPALSEDKLVRLKVPVKITNWPLSTLQDGNPGVYCFSGTDETINTQGHFQLSPVRNYSPPVGSYEGTIIIDVLFKEYVRDWTCKISVIDQIPLSHPPGADIDKPQIYVIKGRL